MSKSWLGWPSQPLITHTHTESSQHLYHRDRIVQKKVGRLVNIMNWHKLGRTALVFDWKCVQKTDRLLAVFCSHKAILKCMFIHQIPKSLPYLRRLHVSGWIALHDLIRREVYGRPWPPAPAGWLITKWGSKLQKDWLECSLAYIIRLKWKLWKVLQIHTIDQNPTVLL